VPGRFEESAGIIDRPGGPLATSGLAAIGQLDGTDRVPADDLILYGAGERSPERIAGISAASRGKYLVAALADNAAAAYFFGAAGILALVAAQADAG
jgi:hypothetical protein